MPLPMLGKGAAFSVRRAWNPSARHGGGGEDHRGTLALLAARRTCCTRGGVKARSGRPRIRSDHRTWRARAGTTLRLLRLRVIVASGSAPLQPATSARLSRGNSGARRAPRKARARLQRFGGRACVEFQFMFSPRTSDRPVHTPGSPRRPAFPRRPPRLVTASDATYGQHVHDGGPGGRLLDDGGEQAQCAQRRASSPNVRRMSLAQSMRGEVASNRPPSSHRCVWLTAAYRPPVMPAVRFEWLQRGQDRDHGAASAAISSAERARS